MNYPQRDFLLFPWNWNEIWGYKWNTKFDVFFLFSLSRYIALLRYFGWAELRSGDNLSAKVQCIQGSSVQHDSIKTNPSRIDAFAAVDESIMFERLLSTGSICNWCNLNCVDESVWLTHTLFCLSFFFVGVSSFFVLPLIRLLFVDFFYFPLR